MVNSWWGAEVIDKARHHNANDPKEEIEIDKPRFKGRLGWNHERLQQGEYHNKENAGKHVRNQLSHTLKIAQTNETDVKNLQKDIVKQEITGESRRDDGSSYCIHQDFTRSSPTRG